MTDLGDVVVRRRLEDESSTERSILAALESEGLRAYKWSNRPGDFYVAHSHSYNKVIWVIQGIITFNLPELSKEIELNEGDRLDLPANIVHEATVGKTGVVCLEAHR